jgi:hypothetical protein
MNREELETTDIWNLYEKGRNYCRLINMYTDTDKNYRMYNGNQWEGIKLKGIEPVQLNFIKPIVKYKIGIINSNQWAINFSSENFESREFRQTAEKTCELLNKKASKIWEKDGLDLKVRQICKDAAINDIGIMYVTYDEEEQTPINEIIDKNDIYFGNENDPDIQTQPYIIIKRRMPVILVQNLAEKNGASEEEIKNIRGDSDTFEQAGEHAKYEIDDMCTILTKMYKKDGIVQFSIATKCVVIKEETNTGLEYYPVATMRWEEKKGSARGEGEVRHLIPNQLEVNKTIMRRLIVAKQTAYPTKVINTDKVQNPSDVDKVGVTIKTKNGMTVEDVNRVIGIVSPAQMSTDVEKLQNELVNLSRDLAGAGDVATGDIDPESASGRAILAVQQASQQPLIEQVSALKNFIEDLARIWLDHIITYSVDGVILEEDVTDQASGEEYTQLVNIPQSVLQELQATVKVDITPKGAFDKYAQEVSLENLLKAGYFNVQRLSELKTYYDVLDDDSTMPKRKLEQAIEKMEEEQRKIAEIQAQANILKQRASTFLDSDPDAQAETIKQAMQQTTAERQESEAMREGMAEERENVE